MTQDECIRRFHHQLWGVMLDASRSVATGAAKSLLEDQLMRKVDACIGQIWSECQCKCEVESAKKRS